MVRFNTDGTINYDTPDDIVIDRSPIADDFFIDTHTTIVPRYNFIDELIPPALINQIAVNPQPLTEVPPIFTPPPVINSTSLGQSATTLTTPAPIANPVGNGGYFSSMVSPTNTGGAAVQKKQTKNQLYIILAVVAVVIILIITGKKK